MKLARILLYYKIDNVRTSYFIHCEGSDEFAHLARTQKVLPEGVRLCQRFFDEGRDDPNTTIRGPTSAGQQTPLKLRFTVVPLMAKHRMLHGLVAL